LSGIHIEHQSITTRLTPLYHTKLQTLRQMASLLRSQLDCSEVSSSYMRWDEIIRIVLSDVLSDGMPGTLVVLLA